MAGKNSLKIPEFRKIHLTFVMIVFFTSCTATRSNLTPTVNPNDIQYISQSGQLKIFLDWEFASSLPFVSRETLLKTHQQMLFKTIDETACCIIVQNPQNADIIIQGMFRSDISAPAKFFSQLSNFTLFIIPSWREVRVEITAQVQSGVSQKSYELNDSMRITNWLPLVFTMPFLPSVSMQEIAMSQNLYRTLLLQIERDGFFGN